LLFGKYRFRRYDGCEDQQVKPERERAMQQAGQFDVFLSHSSHDKLVVRALAERLKSDGLKVWFDEWVIRVGDSIPHQIEAGLEYSTVLVLCMSAQAFASDWATLESQTFRFRDPLNKQRRFMPLLLTDAAIPGSLSQFKYVDWRADREQAYRELREACEQARTALAEAKLAQAAQAVPPLPQSSPQPSPSPSIKADIDRITRYAPEQLHGRETETAMLTTAWQQAMASTSPGAANRPHIISLVALGGEGKTALLARWVLDLAAQDWPGCDAVFGWTFYSQGSEQQMAASSELFIDAALRFFGAVELAASNQSGVDKARHLAQVVGARRVLLLLDGLEPLQYAPTAVMAGALRDGALAQLLRSLASHSLGLCVLTTRYSIPDLKAFWRTTAPEHPLTRLSAPAGVALLRMLAVRGSDAECAALVAAVQGHALSIHLFGAYLRDAHAGDIRQRDRVHLHAADALEQGGHAWRVMDAYVAWLAGDGVAGRRALALLKLLGLFDRPASGECIGALLQAPVIAGLTDDLIGLDDAAHNISYTRLQQARLLSVQRDGGDKLLALDAHPLLREYFAKSLEQQQLPAWQAAHQRLYTYLCAHTQDKPKPTLDDLQPLYQAVAHGCKAGLVQQAFGEVYKARIVRGDEAYSVHQLGAFGTALGAVACFFVQAWQRVNPVLRESDQAWLLNEAAFHLRALGRLRQATEPVRAGLAMADKQGAWKNAAVAAGNLSELGLTLGDVAGALHDAEQAVAYADRSGDAFQRMGKRTTHAAALHQAGQQQLATKLFCDAEAMQAEWQPYYPLLYSVQGFRYCDVLLAAPELGAWQCSSQGCAAPSRFASVADTPQPPVSVALSANNTAGAPDGLLQTCHSVRQRATQTLDWWMNHFTNASLLDIALDHLTLGRAALFVAMLADTAIAPCQAELQLAVDGLRQSGYMDDLPRALLSRAWLLAHTRHHIGSASAQADLDEAWDIAERGPMPLFLADIHLYRAALFHHITPYPWQSAAYDLAEARRLIETHGYLRRMPFVAVVEQVPGIQAK
jgi:hypothetical protein